MYAMRRLGALGAATKPPPVTGFDWYPVMVKDQSGRLVHSWFCPSPVPYGCKVYQGYAWALAEKSTSEFHPAPTPVPPPPPAPPKPPTSVPAQQRCHDAFVMWMQAHPEQARCVPAPDEDAWYKLCAATLAGQLSQSQMLQQWQQLVDQRCRQQNPPAPPKPPSPPVAPPQPPVVPPAPPYQPPDGSGGGGGGGGSTDNEPPTDVSVLRSVGPVVGIGLVIAAGFTLYRTRGSGKGRRKRRRRR